VAAKVSASESSLPPMTLVTHIESIVARSCSTFYFKIDICSTARKSFEAVVCFIKLFCTLLETLFAALSWQDLLNITFYFLLFPVWA
jgi:hypothetical protein